MTDEAWMRLVIGKTRPGVERGQTPFGAGVVKDGAVVGLHNAAWGANDPTAHAEVEAIREACKRLDTADLSGCVIYSTCAPCPMCFGACHWANISRVVYGVSLEDSIRAGLGDLPIPPETMRRLGNSRMEIVGGVLVDDNLELFRLWADLNRNRHR